MNNQDYISQLAEIPHFKLHPELIPYVGPYYDHLKIVLIGESHFIKAGYDENISTDHLPENWYKKSIDELADMNQSREGWFTTHKVINNYLYENPDAKGSAKKFPNRTRSHKIFTNTSKSISKAIKDNYKLEITPEDALKSCVFFNYFQRPSIRPGGTIKQNDVDITEAFNVYNEIINILNPNLIVMVSKKAYKTYSKRSPQLLDKRLNYTKHPGLPPNWHSDEGEEKFEKLLNKYFAETEIDFSYIKSLDK